MNKYFNGTIAEDQIERFSALAEDQIERFSALQVACYVIGQEIDNATDLDQTVEITRSLYATLEQAEKRHQEILNRRM